MPLLFPASAAASVSVPFCCLLTYILMSKHWGVIIAGPAWLVSRLSCSISECTFAAL